MPNFPTSSFLSLKPFAGLQLQCTKKYDIILFYIKLFYYIIYSNIIIVVLHIYNNIKNLGIQFEYLNFCYIFKCIDCEHQKKVVSSCQSNDLSLIVNYCIKLQQMFQCPFGFSVFLVNPELRCPFFNFFFLTSCVFQGTTSSVIVLQQNCSSLFTH